jgi:LytS/YehU family sensor histidine kinase
MSMQPLLENVFKHTVEKRRQPTAISIAERQGDMLRLRVQDDSGALPAGVWRHGPRGGGIGVRNLRERLAALYGDRAAFDLTQLSPAGVLAEVRLPCVS